MAKKEGSQIDQTLISYAGNKSPNEISELTGIPPEKIAQRTKELLDSIDILTIQQKQARLIVQLENMVAEAQSRMAGAQDRNLSTLINSARSAVSATLKEIRDMEADKKDKSQELEAASARRLVSMLEQTYFVQLDRLSNRFPDVEKDDLALEFREILATVAAEHDAL